WDGSTWTIVPSFAQQGQLFGIAGLTSTDLWAVGAHDTPAGALLLHWDGTAWTAVAAPSVGPGVQVLTAVSAATAADIWAVGYYARSGSPRQTLILHWDGGPWQVVPSPNPGAQGNELAGVVARTAQDSWAVGDFRPAGSFNQPLVLRWEGTTWRVIPCPD